MKSSNIRHRTKGERLKLHFSICSSLLMIMGVFNAVATYGQAEIGAPTGGNNTNDWIIEKYDDITHDSTDGDITLSANLFVKGTLHLSDINLIFDCNSDGQFQLCVDRGGSLFIDHCTIGTTAANYHFKFRVYGQLNLLNSDVSDIWTNENGNVGGIQIYSDSALIENCDLSDMSIAIYVYHASPTITGNTISGCEYGILIDSDSILTPSDFELDPDTLSFSDSNPVNGQVIDVSVDVKNNGGCPALATVRFYDGNPIFGGIRIDTEQTYFLISGQTQTFQASWHALSGNHDIYAIVNEDQTIQETSYANNMGFKSITPSFQITLRKAGPGSNEFTAMTNHDVYVYDPAGESLGLSDKTDIQGIVKFSLASGSYKFKIDYLGYTFWSDVFCLPCTLENYNFDIEQKSVKATFSPTYNGNGVTPSGNFPVHVFTEAGADTELDGTTETTNNIISVNFNLPFRSFKFRLDYAGYSYWSISTSWVDVVISPALAKAVITFKDGSIAKDGVPITAYTSLGTSVGTINTGSNNEQTGQATFYLTDNGYKFRAVYDTYEYWSKVVTLSGNSETDLEINKNFNLFHATIKRSTSEILSDVNVHADSTSGSFVSVTNTTNANGIVGLRLPDGTYQFTVNYIGYEFISDSISVPSYLSTTMTITHHEVTVKLQKEQNSIATKVPGVQIQLYKANEYLGKTETTDESDGKVLFNLPEKEYKFCGIYLGHPFSSDPFTPSSGPDNTVTITIDVDDIDVEVVRKYGAVETAVNGATVHSFLSGSGTEVGTSKLTDGSGICTFTLPQESYYFRTQYLIYTYQSATVTWTDAEISISEGKLELTVKIGDTVQSDRNAYVFDDSSYIGKSGTTDTYGEVTFQIPAGDHMIGIGTSSSSIQYWTANIAVASGEMASVTQDIGADLTVAAIDINPNPIRICEYAAIKATISNDGSFPAGDFVVRFYNGDPSSAGTQIGSDEPIKGLDLGDTIDVPITWTKDITGNYEIYIVADAILEVEESNENNNKDHKTLTVIAENRFPFIYKDIILTCDYGIYLDHSSPEIQSTIFDGCGYSIYCDGSSPTILDCLIYSPVTAPVLSKSDSDPEFIDSSFARKSMTVEDTSTVTVSYHFVPTIVDSVGDGIENQQVDITGWNQQGSAFSGTTDFNGQTTEILLKEFVQGSNQVTYYSPYHVNVNYGENEFMLPMVSKKALEIHAGGDTDEDGLIDSNEGGLSIYSFEAESMAFGSDQIIDDVYASDDKAIEKNSENDKIIDSRLSSVLAGTYKCYVRARANPSGSRMSIDIYSNNNHIVSGETHSLGENYEWYSTISQANQDIVLQNEGDITMTVKDMDAVTDGKIFVDRIMIVKLKNAQGEATGIKGQITDPTATDTDMDGMIDGEEVREEIFWFEAEDSPAAQSLVADAAASNGKTVSTADGNIINIPNPSVGVLTGKYQYLVNARSEGASSPPSIKLEPCIDNVVQNTITNQIGSSYNWFASQEFEVSSSPSSVTLKVTAIIPEGGQTRIYVDKIVLVQRKEIDVTNAWSTQVSGTKTSPVIDSNFVYVGSNDPLEGNGVYALDKKTGESMHEYIDDDIKSVDSAPLVYDGKTYLAATMNPNLQIPVDHGALMALNMGTDTGIWTNIYVSPLVGTPATDGKVIVIGAKDGTIHIIDRLTGGTNDISTSYEILTSPVISNNKAFVGVKSILQAPNNPKLYCIDLNPTGPGQQYNIKWTWYSDNKLTTAPLVADGMVIFPAADNKIHALNENEGTEIWKTDINFQVLSTPVCFDTMIIFGADDGKLYGLNEDTGAISWSDIIGNQAIKSSPAIANKQVIFGSESGFLCNYEPYAGDAIWNENIGNSPDAIRTGPAVGDIDSDGKLEIIICKGMFVFATDGAGIYYRDGIPWAKESKNWSNNGNARYQGPFLATDPLIADTDNDGLNDSNETGVSWKWNRIESEDYSGCSIPVGGPNIINHQFTVNLTMVNQQDSYIKFSQFSIPETGMYHIIAEGIGTVQFKSGSYNGPAPPNADYNNPNNYQIIGTEVPVSYGIAQEDQKDILTRAINIELRRGIVPNVIINPPPNLYANIPPIDPLTEVKEMRYAGMEAVTTSESNSVTVVTKRWHIEQDYELGAGLHEIKLLLDNSIFNGPFCSYAVGGGSLSVIPQKVDISSDSISICKVVYSAQNPDMDNDGLTDGNEIELGFYPLNSDVDKDGISDINELYYYTNPELRDTDLDGLRDRVELGIQAGDTDHFTPYDNGEPLNQDLSVQTTTNPANPDTDGDGLPDGAVESWGYNYVIYKRYNINGWGRGYGIVDWSSSWTGPKFWEGEDYNRDGAQAAGAWTFNAANMPTGGETNPSAQDTDQDGIPDGTDTDKDGMPDGYEVWFRLNPKVNDAAQDTDIHSLKNGQVDPSYYYKTPWDFPANPVAAPDGLSNLNEYIVGSNPKEKDTDLDGVMDGGEVPVLRSGNPVGTYPVMYRTKVPNGGINFTYYGTIHTANQYEWVWVNGIEFGYSTMVGDADKNSQYAPDVNIFEGEVSNSANPLKFIATLEDGTIFLMDANIQTVCVWAPGTFTLKFFSGEEKGRVYVYSTSLSNHIAPTSATPLLAYRNQEVYFSDPLMPDSDGDGRIDGMEVRVDWVYDPVQHVDVLTFMDTNGNCVANDVRDYSADGDGLCNARELDADEDGLADRNEAYCTAGIYNPSSGKPSPYNGNTDNDALGDSLDPLPLDKDNDGLTGYPAVVNQWGNLIAFTTGSLETLYATNNNNYDSDNDKLLDGPTVTIETSDPRYNTFDGHIYKTGSASPYTFHGEMEYHTNPNQPDSDSDGLIDGIEVDASDGYTTDPLNFDTDGDNLPDGWVDGWDVNINTYNPATNDVSWHQTINLDTHRQIWEGEDLDQDGQVVAGAWSSNIIHDNHEAEVNPCSADSDNGGGSDGLEIVWYKLVVPNRGTLDPLVGTDDEIVGWTYGVANGWILNYFPSLAGHLYDFNPDDNSADTDGLTNIQEYKLGTSPVSSDTDNDNMPDNWEAQYGLDPTNPADANSDKDKDGLSNLNEKTLTCDPTNVDSDNDGLWDGYYDANGNGICDSNELGEDRNHNGIVESTETSPTDSDTDKDFIPDGQEISGHGVVYDINEYQKLDGQNIDLSKVKTFCIANKMSVAIKFTSTVGSITYTDNNDGTYTLSNPTESYDWVVIHIKYNKATVGIPEEDLAMYWKDGNNVKIFADPVRNEFTHVDRVHSYVWGRSTTLGTVCIGDYRETDYDEDGLKDSDELLRGSEPMPPWNPPYDSLIHHSNYPTSKATWGDSLTNGQNRRFVTGWSSPESPVLASNIFTIETWGLEKGYYQLFVQAQMSGDVYADYKDMSQYMPIEIYLWYNNYNKDSDILCGLWQKAALSHTNNFDAKWVTTSIFWVGDEGKLRFGAENPYWHGLAGKPARTGAISVFSIFLLKVDEDNLRIKSRQMTSSTVPDTDLDGMNDFTENNWDTVNDVPLVYWFDSEDYNAMILMGWKMTWDKYFEITTSEGATYGRETEIKPWLTIYLNTLKPFEDGTYVVFVRARTGHGDEGTRIGVSANSNNNMPLFHVESEEYRWYRPGMALIENGPLIIGVDKESDAAGTFTRVYIDQVVLVKILNRDGSDTRYREMLRPSQSPPPVNPPPVNPPPPPINPQNEDIDNDGLINIDEISLVPPTTTQQSQNDPTIPGYCIFYSNEMDTKMYDCWKSIGGKTVVLGWSTTNNQKLDTWITVRQGVSFTVKCYTSATLTWATPANARDPDKTESPIGNFKYSFPQDAQIGKYVLSIKISDTVTRILTVYVIFKLPGTAGNDDSVQLTANGLKSYEYVEDAAYFRDRIAIYWFDEADIINNGDHWTAVSACAFYTRHYSVTVLDKALSFAGGTSSTFTAATQIKDKMTQVRAMVTMNAYADMDVWLNTATGKSFQGNSGSECTAFAAASTAMLRSIGIPARPVFFDRACGDGGSFTTGTECWIDGSNGWYVFTAYEPGRGIRTRSDWGTNVWTAGGDHILVATAGPSFKIEQIQMIIGWTTGVGANARDFDTHGVLLVGEVPTLYAKTYWDFIQHVKPATFSSTNTGTIEAQNWVITECNEYWNYVEPTYIAPMNVATHIYDPEPNDSLVGG